MSQGLGGMIVTNRFLCLGYVLVQPLPPVELSHLAGLVPTESKQGLEKPMAGVVGVPFPVGLAHSLQEILLLLLMAWARLVWDILDSDSHLVNLNKGFFWHLNYSISKCLGLMADNTVIGAWPLTSAKIFCASNSLSKTTLLSATSRMLSASALTERMP